MKNKSWKYPSSTLDDKLFDSNNDGKLDAFETLFRDAHLTEMSLKSEQHNQKSQHRPDISYDSKEHNIEEYVEHSTIFYIFVFLLGIVLLIGIIGIIFNIISSVFEVLMQ